MSTCYPYLRDILDQPEAVQSTADRLASQSVPSELLKWVTRRAARIVLTGMGSSYHALRPLYHRLLRSGLPVWLTEAGELLVTTQTHEISGTALVVCSQSGESAEIVRIMKSRACDVPVIGITNTPGSVLDQFSDVSIFTNAGHEETVATKTYLASLLAATWLGDRLLSEQATDGVTAAHLVDSYLDGWITHVEELKREAAGIRQLFIVGRGDSLAAAYTGALIIKEAVRVPAEGLSGSAFRHGPIEMVTPDVLVMVLTATGEAERLGRRLAGDIGRLGGRSSLVSFDTASSALSLPSAPAAIMPLLEILPFQLLTIALGELAGFVPGNFRHMTKVTRSE